MTDYTVKRFNPYTKEELVAALKEYAELKNVKYVASKDFCIWFGISEALSKDTLENGLIYVMKQAYILGTAELRTKYIT